MWSVLIIIAFSPIFTWGSEIIDVDLEPQGPDIILLNGTKTVGHFQCFWPQDSSPIVQWSPRDLLIQTEQLYSTLGDLPYGTYQLCLFCRTAKCLGGFRMKVSATEREVLAGRINFLEADIGLDCPMDGSSEFGVEWLRFHVSKFRAPDLKEYILADEFEKLDAEPPFPTSIPFGSINQDDGNWSMCGWQDYHVRYCEIMYLKMTVLGENEMLMLEEVASNKRYFGIVIAVTFVIAFAAIAILIIIFKCRVKNEDQLKNMFPTPATMSVRVSFADSEWEFDRDRLTLKGQLGEGAFGRVFSAQAQDLVPGEPITRVAVKMLKENHTGSDVKELLAELEVMKKVCRHPNIINLLGCCTMDGPHYVIVEFARHGNLKDFLRNHRPNESINSEQSYILSNDQLISFAHQIACGMEHLSSLKCIHRDLAARNVLVSDAFTMKIADFGLARNMDYYRKRTSGRLPICWMAPESLQDGYFDSRSDVWSFGIVLWEIETLGAHPFMAIESWKQLQEDLQSGKRLGRPEGCSEELYRIMSECWQLQAGLRPTFGDLVRQLDHLLYGGINEICDESVNHGQILGLNSLSYVEMMYNESFEE